jgi:hypothetical protein
MENLNINGAIIITPERFLQRAQVKEVRSLVFLIFKKLQIALDPTAITADHYLGTVATNLYVIAFDSAQSAEKTEKTILARLDKILPELNLDSPELHFRSLPPLFLLSNTTFVIQYDDLILLAQPDGPIVPVISLQSVRERGDDVLRQLHIIYNLQSPQFMNLDLLTALLQPKKPITSISPPPSTVVATNQKNTHWTPL